MALPWKRIYKTFPKKNNRRILRGWSLEEIRGILKHCGSSKYRAMVLVLASSGVRLGGSQLRWDDIEPMYKVGDKMVPRSEMPGKGKGSLACASVRVYVGSTEGTPHVPHPGGVRRPLGLRGQVGGGRRQAAPA